MSAWVDTHPWRAFWLLTAFYLVVVCALSSMKLLWLDELITLHIARLGSVGAIWHALANGADPNPPLIHVAVMLCRSVFGEHELALRLPAILGYWVGMLSIFSFLKRRLPAVWALAGTVLLMDMGAFEWSYESRSYAVFFGTTMLAFYCWSRLAVTPEPVGQSRYHWLIGMTVALALGICTNYFAVLAFFPIAAGELTRTVVKAGRGRRTPGRRAMLAGIDWLVLGGLFVGATPLLAFRPLINTSIAKFAPYAWNKVTVDQAINGYLDMVETTLYLLLPLLAFAFVVRWIAGFCENCQRRLGPRWIGKIAAAQSKDTATLLSLPEAVAVFVLMAYPFVGYVVASLRGGMLSARFVIPVCFGFAIAGTVAAFGTFGHLRGAASIALVLCLTWLVARESFIGYWYEEQKQSFYKVVSHMPAAEYPGEPIVVADNLMVLPFQYYAPQEMAKRVVYPIDFPAIMRDRGEASGEINLWEGRQSIYNFTIVPLAEFERSVGRYIILNGDRDWLVNDLHRHNYPVRHLTINTRAGATAFWATPLSHGVPVFFEGEGDQCSDMSADDHTVRIPFDLTDNLPRLPR